MSLGPLPLILSWSIEYGRSEIMLLPNLSHENVMHFCLVFLPCSLGLLGLAIISHHAMRKPKWPVERHMWEGNEFPSSQSQLSSQPSSQLIQLTLPQEWAILKVNSPSPKRSTKLTVCRSKIKCPVQPCPNCRFTSKINAYCYVTAFSGGSLCGNR